MTPPTEEEKRERVMRFLMQKREQYTISILQGIVANPEVFNYGMTFEGVINHAVSLADKLLEKIYPLTDGDEGGEVREAAEE